MKVKPRNLKGIEKTKYLDALYTALETLKSREEIKNFLKDLLTESERVMLGRRITVAQMLLEGKTYAEIMGELRVGIDTIMRVHHWLEDENEGYEKALKEIHRMKIAKIKITDHHDSSALGNLKRRYPLHFLLFNIFDQMKRK